VLREAVRDRPGLLTWSVCAALAALGLLTNNPAALFVATAGWLTQVIPVRIPLARALPLAGVVLAAVMIAVSELIWLVERTMPDLPIDLRHLSSAMPLLAAAAAGSLTFRKRDTVDATRRADGDWSREGLHLAAVLAVVSPCLLLGTSLAAAPFALPGFEHMHNLVRATYVEHLSYIPYGPLGPAHNFSGDYYPRGFHLVADWFNAAAGNESNATLHRWVVGYLRMYWIFWALAVLAVGSAARCFAARLGAPGLVAGAAGVAGAALLLLPSVYHGVIEPGFGSFGVGVLAVAVSLAAAVEGRYPTDRLWVGLIACAAFVVGSHGWLLTTPVVGAVAAFHLIPTSRGSRRSRGSALLQVTVPIAAVLASARPWWFTLVSGDAAAQAKEPGRIDPVPLGLGGILLVGCLLGLVAAFKARRMRHLIAPLAAAAAVSFIAFRASGNELDLYYPRKVLWADLILVLPLGIGGWTVLAAGLLRRLPAGESQSRERLTVGLATAVLISLAAPTVLDLFRAAPSQVSLASNALDNAITYQLVAVQVDGADADFATSMWGRAGRNLHGAPSLDVSEIELSSMTPEVVCTFNDPAGGLALVVATRSDDGEIELRPC
jgi:hypothetical protein